MAGDRLQIYNLALGHLGERRLATLAENREPRRVLDDLWDQTKNECLEEALWNFMIRASSIDASTSVVPSFGFSYAFRIPDDWVRTVMISTVETFAVPLLDYMEETGYWYANWTPIFVRFISNDAAYGNDLSRWTANFCKYMSYQLAQYGCKRITGADTMLQGPEGITKRLHKAKIKAKSNDAMNQPPGEMPAGTWVRSRRGAFRGIPLPGGSGYDD